MATKNSKNPTKAQGSKEIVPLRPVDFRLVKKPEGEYVLYGYIAQNESWVELPTTIL